MRYFAIEGILYKLTEQTYKRLCKRYPLKDRNGEVIKGAFDTESRRKPKSGYFDHERNDAHSDCLDWIIEHSKEMVKVEVLNY